MSMSTVVLINISAMLFVWILSEHLSYREADKEV